MTVFFLLMFFDVLSELDYWNTPVWNIQFDELDFFPILNWIFTTCGACKIKAWNRQKNPVHQTQFFKNQVQKDKGTEFLLEWILFSLKLQCFKNVLLYFKFINWVVLFLSFLLGFLKPYYYKSLQSISCSFFKIALNCC